MNNRVETVPTAFIWRRLHSLMGLWLVLFLMEHLLTNSQAALLLGESGRGFVRMVNALHNLPYLQAVEIFLLGVPFAIHMVWGIRYLFTAKFNSFPSNGSKPHLKYGRNRAYTWQRITSWLLVIFLITHVVKFRFVEYPGAVNVGSTPTYFVKVGMDSGLYTVSQRLGATIYDEDALIQMGRNRSETALKAAAAQIRERSEDGSYRPNDEAILRATQEQEEKNRLYRALSSVQLKEREVLVAASDFGTATLFSVRDTFKNPWWVAFYTAFVLSACFHAFNGLWTSMLTWGWVLKVSAQKKALKFAITLMVLVAFLGLAAVWGTYFINLKT